MNEQRIESSWTINELLRREPLSATVLNALGVDTCCGGGDTINEAAAAAGTSGAALIDAVIAALNEAAAQR